MMSTIAQLKRRVLEAEAEREFYKSLVDSFFSGDVPENASLQHMILAKFGRIRLEQLKKKPILLHTD